MFKAGVLVDGELKMSDEGVPQGSICSPVLSNVMAHHVIDEWFEYTVKQHCKGKVAMFRYADDLVICCQYASDATRIKQALAKRLNKYKLKMNEDKSKLISFSKASMKAGTKQGSFDFLGFTIYLGTSKKGHPIPMVKTNGKRLRSKLKKVNQWIKAERSRMGKKAIWKTFSRKLQGHIAYYAVSFNLNAVNTFKYQATKIVYKWLNRRSQRRSCNWENFEKFMEAYPLPKVKIYYELY
jgi:hypothetical protein